MPQMLLGVNYWPRRKAMRWWSDFDPAEVREEFSIIRELGLGLVRIFLLWDDFQPYPDAVSLSSLSNLEVVCDFAASLGLALDVTFFTGHMSGPNWAPRWLLGGPRAPGNRQVISAGRPVRQGYRNMYSDPQALGAQRLLLRAVVGALKGHPGVAFWNLGNEPDLFARPRTARQGAAWVAEMSGLVKALDPGHLVTIGLHADSLLEDNGLRVDQVFAHTHFAVMHAYPQYLSGWARHPLDPELVPFACALTAALSSKPVLMEEFGGATAPPGAASFDLSWRVGRHARRQFLASEEDLARYLDAVLPRLRQAGALGAVVWCFADYAPGLWDLPPCDRQLHERHFGLVRPDGTIKPHAFVLRDFAASKPLVQAPERIVELGCTGDEFYRAPLQKIADLYARWLESVSST